MPKSILAIFAHPDDEGMVSGTLARYSRQGYHVALACATKGEAGEISDPALATPQNLGQVREQELRCACDIIGIQELILLGYCDSGMDGTPGNERITAFIQADPDMVRGQLVGLIRRIRPEVVITFEPFGWYGHPDHVFAGRYTTEAFTLAGEAAAFPETGEPWQPARLFHSAMPRNGFKKIAEYARTHDIDIGMMSDIPFDEPDPMEAQITHALDVSPFVDLKRQATNCHKTQFGEDNPFRKIPPEVLADLNRTEYFIQVAPPTRAERQGELF